MRPQRAPLEAAEEAQLVAPPHSDSKPKPPPPPPPSECDARSCPWKPYSSSKDFEANTALILAVLFSALVFGLTLNATIRCLLRRRDQLQIQDRDDSLQPKPSPSAAVAPPPAVVFSAGMNLAANQAECIICLSEFAEGDEIRVLSGCDHAFHIQCIQQWLSSRSSCPTCRATYPLPSSSSSSSSSSVSCRRGNESSVDV